MKLIVAALLFACTTAAKLDNTYLPPNSAGTAGGNGNFLAAPVQSRTGFRGVTSYDAPASGPLPSSAFNTQNAHVRSYNAVPSAILRYNNDNTGDGTYRFEYETENKIRQHEAGQLKNVGTDQEANVVQGSYSYTGTDGQVYTVDYVADENGFRASGAHLPTPPPIPAEILRSLEANAVAEAAGARSGYPSGPVNQHQDSQANRQYLAPNQAGGYQY